MKILTIYEAKDKTRFDSEKACVDHELLLDKIEAIAAKLPVAPRDMNFCNGKGYIQHTPDAIEQYKNDLLDLIATKIDHDWVKKTRDGKSHPSYLARLLDDSVSPLGNAWSRLLCIDDQCREWGQPFYAAHSHQATHIRLNP